MLRSTLFDEHDDLAVTDAEREASLLVAILVNHPEIGALRIAPVESVLRLTFLLETSPSPEQLDHLKRHLSVSLAALFCLSPHDDHDDAPPFKLTVQSYEGLALLHIVRDLRSLIFEEFTVIAAVVHQCFGDALIIDGDGRHLWLQEGGEGYLGHSLEDLRSLTAQTLIGFRDGGRVLVFNEP